MDMGTKKGSCMLKHVVYDKTSVLEAAKKFPEHSSPSKWYVYKYSSFGCIGTLMKCSAFEFYVTAVYGRVSGIFNG